MSDPPSPLVSVVIPTHNRPSQLARCLASIAAAQVPGPIEVVVVDDGGSAQLEPIVEPLRDSVGAILVRESQGGPGAARNLGVARARGKYILFTDDDCTLDEAAIVAFVERPGGSTGRDRRWPDDQCAARQSVCVGEPGNRRRRLRLQQRRPRGRTLLRVEQHGGRAERNPCVRWIRRGIHRCGGGSRALRPLAPSWWPPGLPARGRHLPLPRPPARELRTPASRLRARCLRVSPCSGRSRIGPDARRSPLPRRAPGPTPLVGAASPGRNRCPRSRAGDRLAGRQCRRLGRGGRNGCDAAALAAAASPRGRADRRSARRRA